MIQRKKSHFLRLKIRRDTGKKIENTGNWGKIIEKSIFRPNFGLKMAQKSQNSLKKPISDRKKIEKSEFSGQTSQKSLKTTISDIKINEKLQI